MKITNLMALGLLSTGLFTACSSDDPETPQVDETKDVVFTSSITGVNGSSNQLESRVNGSKWDANDEIGIFMQLKDSEMSNKKYLAQPDGSLKAVAGNELKYPMEGTADFLAYYPFSANAGNKKVAISVTEQQNPTKIDFLYADNAKGIQKNQTVNLLFVHKLSQITINVKGDETIKDLKGLNIALKGMNTSATFNLADGSLAVTDSKADIQMKMNAEGSLAEAIVLPTSSVENMKMVFSLEGKTFEWPIAIKDGNKLSAGCKYTFNATLSIFHGQPSVQMGNATITDWVEKAGGDINVDFGGGDKPNPEPEPKPEPADGTVLFYETFGNPVKENGKYWPAINKYTGWTDTHKKNYTDPLLGSNSYSNANIRSTSTMDGHLWLAAGKDAALRIESFDAKAYKTVQLSYSIAANQKGNQNVIIVSTDKGEITVPSVETPLQNAYQEVILTLPVDFTYIQLTSKAETNKVGYRIDNIKIVASEK